MIGRLRDTAYFGDFFVHHVVLEDGQELRVSRPNLRRGADRMLEGQDSVVVTWDREAAMVLPE